MVFRWNFPGNHGPEPMPSAGIEQWTPLASHFVIHFFFDDPIKLFSGQKKNLFAISELVDSTKCGYTVTVHCCRFRSSDTWVVAR